MDVQKGPKTTDQVFHGGFTQDIDVEIVNAVGPYAEGRTLQEPNPAKWIYVAPNGNDANSGLTPAQAKLTLFAARQATSALRPVIMIIRNGYTGALDFQWFAVNGDLLLGQFFSNQGIQVELGEVADIYLDDGLYIEIRQTAFLNGVTCHLSPRFNVGGQTWNVFFRSFATFKYCTMILNTVQTEANLAEEWHTVFSNLITPFGASITYCAVYAQSGFHLEVQTYPASLVLSNLLFVMWNNGVIDYETPQGTKRFVRTPLDLRQVPNNSDTITFTRIMTANFAGNSLITVSGPQVGPWIGIPTIQLKGCCFTDGAYLIGARLGGTVFYEVNVNLVDCVDQTLEPVNFIPTATLWTFSDPGVFILYDNRLTPPYLGLVDLDAAISEFRPDGVRLKLQGKPTPNGRGRYILPSPLEDQYRVGPSDVAPWDETVTFGPYEWPDRYELQFAPGDQQKEKELRKAVERMDEIGDLKRAYAAIGWKWEFGYPSYANNRDRAKIESLHNENTPIRWYPEGDDSFVSLYKLDDRGTLDLSASPPTLTPLTSAGTLEPSHDAGIIVVLRDGVGGEWHLFILDNDSDKWYLADKYGTGFPPSSGVYFAYLQYYLIKFEVSPISSKQAANTDFRRGGGHTLLPPGDTQGFEPNDWKISFRTVNGLDDPE